METLAAMVRSLFGTQAVVITLAILMDGYYILTSRQQSGPAGAETPAVFVTLFSLVGIYFIALNTLGWWMLRHGKPGARVATFWISLANLFLPPVGTLAAILGFIVCAKAESLEHTQAPESPEPVEGDGTNLWVGRMVNAAQFLFLVIGAEWWYQWSQKHHLRIGDLLPNLLLVLFATMVNVLLHELGHVLAGWWLDMRLVSFTVGPVQWKREEGRSRFHFSLAGFLGGGAAGLVPVHLRNLNRRRILMGAAGPLASLLTAVASTVIALNSPGASWEWMWNFFATLSVFSSLAAIVNLIPLRPQDLYSDGAQIYQMLRGGPWAEVHAARAMVASSLVTPLRPSQWDTALLERCAGFQKTGTDGILMRLYQLMHAVDSGDLEQASEHLASAVALYPQVEKTFDVNLLPEIVVMTALLEKNPTATRWWWQQFETKNKKTEGLGYWSALTAWQWSEGNEAEAWQGLEQWERCVAQLPQSGAYDFDRSTARMLRTALEAGAPDVRQPSFALSRSNRNADGIARSLAVAVPEQRASSASGQ